jgi:TRAP-type C4-dicarboxylate transport system permease small subunit
MIYVELLAEAYGAMILWGSMCIVTTMTLAGEIGKDSPWLFVVFMTSPISTPVVAYILIRNQVRRNRETRVLDAFGWPW